MAVSAALLLAPAFISSAQKLGVCCGKSDDIASLLKDNKIDFKRFDSAAEAVAKAVPGSSVIILAEGYPEKTTELDESLFEMASEKHLRLYVEYPSMLPGFSVGPASSTHFERGVCSSDVFGEALEKNRILAIHDCYYLDIPLKNPDIVIARVAGFDSAVFGIPENAAPILARMPLGDQEMMVCTSRLSNFITARYAPTDAWGAVWSYILRWLLPDREIKSLEWKPVVHPTYAKVEELPSGFEKKSYRRAVGWFFNSGMVMGPEVDQMYETGNFPKGGGTALTPSERTALMPECKAGDGSHGILEGISSIIGADGSQLVRFWRRNDCNGECAGAISLAGKVLKDKKYLSTGNNIAHWLVSSNMMTGDREDPSNPAYGLVGWNDRHHYFGTMEGYEVYYGDDNARTLMGLALAATAAEDNSMDARILRGFLANLRICGQKGFQHDRVDHPWLVDAGLDYFAQSQHVSYSGNFQAYIWAGYLWAYQHCGYKPFLEKAKAGISNFMAVYPMEWGITGIQMDRGRMLLPLAWLVRVEDTPQHRQWLDMVIRDLGSDPDTGAIGDKIEEGRTRFGFGHYKLPHSNEEYGATESPIIQEDTDCACDLLYATNFAFIGLHEAAAATGNQEYKMLEDKLADFLCRVQISSPSRRELDGAWFRAFDFNRWEYWASSADAGWGAWSVESGWTMSWITITQGLRQLDTSFWEYTGAHKLDCDTDAIIAEFFNKD